MKIDFIWFNANVFFFPLGSRHVFEAEWPIRIAHKFVDSSQYTHRMIEFVPNGVFSSNIVIYRQIQIKFQMNNVAGRSLSRVNTAHWLDGVNVFASINMNQNPNFRGSIAIHIAVYLNIRSSMNQLNLDHICRFSIRRAKK